MRVVFKSGVIIRGFWRDTPARRSRCASYSIGRGNARKTEPACHGLLPAYHSRSKDRQIQETSMASRLETYRVQAYNTAKLSENKMHDDTVAQRFGFSGGLVPGVDVMAYMMHVPVAKWGRAFLERGLIEARFVKPVYDGEIADVTGTESDGVLSIEVERRGELCATGTASLPAAAPRFSIADYSETAAVTERKPVSSSSYEPGKWLGTLPLAWAGADASEYLTDVRET